jgi:hypothetical protein
MLVSLKHTDTASLKHSRGSLNLALSVIFNWTFRIAVMNNFSNRVVTGQLLSHSFVRQQTHFSLTQFSLLWSAQRYYLWEHRIGCVLLLMDSKTFARRKKPEDLLSLKWLSLFLLDLESSCLRQISMTSVEFVSLISPENWWRSWPKSIS